MPLGVVVESWRGTFASGAVVEAGAGTLLTFEPDERHSVSTTDGARLLLLLAPCPLAAQDRAGTQPQDEPPSTRLTLERALIERGGLLLRPAAPRQPGSALKPFTYGAAFTKGSLSPGSVIQSNDSTTRTSSVP